MDPQKEIFFFSRKYSKNYIGFDADKEEINKLKNKKTIYKNTKKIYFLF